MAVTKSNGLRKTRNTRKRRRSASVGLRARYAPKTARVNRSLIKGNARTIARLKALMPAPIHCDWQQLNTILCDTSTTQNPVTFTNNGRTLTDFGNWVNVLRQSQVVSAKSSTTVYRMSINFRVSLFQSYWAQVTIFVVTLRRDFANRNPEGTDILVLGGDYNGNRLTATPDPNFMQNIRLNPAIFKVHYCRNITLAQGGYGSPPTQIGGNDAVSNPFATYRKGQINIKPNIKVRNPRTTLPWTSVPIEQLPPGNKYYLITAVTQQSAIGANPRDCVTIDTDLLASTRNSG